jgi:hypothetical protein
MKHSRIMFTCGDGTKGGRVTLASKLREALQDTCGEVSGAVPENTTLASFVLEIRVEG